MKKVSCPICHTPMDARRPEDWPEWPFCSARCKLIDLGRWLDGSYRIESPASTEDLDDADADDRSPKSAAPSAVPHRDEA